jgi:hypothetical protein
VPWIVVSVCVVTSAILLFILRTMLDRENKRRDREPRSTQYDEVFVEKVAPDGSVTIHRVDKVRHFRPFKPGESQLELNPLL